ncbi:hypothetical protein GcM1_227047 [Golovinomyces cichoracearum]|uniref:Uncharacterized protein n=1 Tax=Golovinomyces cichoracearum TaxID=62708 RepID=A0A420IPF6_9PEZI|nr:hypothetical protein GcM1_227047 [Golovinomyces cichoracearum]
MADLSKSFFNILATKVSCSSHLPDIDGDLIAISSWLAKPLVVFKIFIYSNIMECALEAAYCISASGCVDRTNSERSITRHSRSLNLSRSFTILRYCSVVDAARTLVTIFCVFCKHTLANSSKP